jgi:hypothetical protein
MLLPTKGITPSRALLTVGATVIGLLESPTTVSGLWERFSQANRSAGPKDKITFDWFAMALTMLFALNIVGYDAAGQLERRHVPA